MPLECRIRDGVKGIHLTVNRMGRPSGRAFIEMEHEEDVNKALEKHRQYLGPRYVEGLSSPKAVWHVTVGESGVCVLKKSIKHVLCFLHCVLQCMKWRREMLRPSLTNPQKLKLRMGWCGSEVSLSPPPRMTLLNFFQVLDIIISSSAGHF